MLCTVTLVLLQFGTHEVLKVALGRVATDVDPIAMFDRIIRRVEKAQPDSPEDNVLVIIASIKQHSSFDAVGYGSPGRRRREEAFTCKSDSAAVYVVLNTVSSLARATEDTSVLGRRVASPHPPVGDPGVSPGTDNCCMYSEKGKTANDFAVSLDSESIHFIDLRVPARKEMPGSVNGMILPNQGSRQDGLVKRPLNHMDLVVRVRSPSPVSLLRPEFSEDLRGVDVLLMECIISLSTVEIK